MGRVNKNCCLLKTELARNFPACNIIRTKPHEEEKTKLFFGWFFDILLRSLIRYIFLHTSQCISNVRGVCRKKRQAFISQHYIL